MKKIYFIISLALSIGSAKAQNNIEYHLGIGMASAQELSIRTKTNPLFDVTKTGGENPSYSFSTAGPIRVGIKSHESKRFLLGADFSYTNVEVMTNNNTGINEFSNFAFYTLMASTQYKYIDKPKLSLYTGLDFGISYATAHNKTTERKMNDLTGAFQITFLGARYGSKYGVYGELGFGFHGFANAGLFYRMD